MDGKLHQLIQQLAAPLPEIRDRARVQLVAAGTASVAPLLDALRSPERDIRAGAALCLGALRAPQAAERLVELSRTDPDRTVRPLALRALADLAAPDSALVLKQALLAALADPDMFARALACTGLGRINDEACRRAVQGALRDREEWVRDAARKALAAPSPAAPAAQPAPGAGAMVLAPRATPGMPAADQLAAGLTALSIERQRQAQEALVALGVAAVPRVGPLLRHELPGARRAAAEVLGALGAAEGLGPLGELLDDEGTTDDLRAVALHAVATILQRVGPGQAYPEEAVRAGLRASDSFVRAAAVAALISAREPDLRDTLQAILEEEDDEWVFAAACRALRAALGPGERVLVPLLLDYLARTTDPDAQLQLLEALRRMLREPPRDRPGAPAGRSEDQDQQQQVVGSASYFLQSDRAEVRRAAGMLLAQVARELDPSTLRAILRLIEERPADSLPLVRAAGRMGRTGDPQVVTTLRRVLVGKDRAAAQEAAAALLALRGREAIDALVEVANSRGGQSVALAAQALAGMDPKAEVAAVRRPDGHWERIIQLHCAGCAALLRWVEREGREELRCPDCDLEHVLSAAGKLFVADRTSFGTCLCAGCRRKQPLVRRGDSELLVCPASGGVHIRPFDHPRQIRLLSDLPLGACTCCAEPQPLIRVNEEVRCYRSRNLYRATQRGFEPAAAGAAVADDVEAINRALLLGTLGIAESGVAAPEDDDESG